MFYAFTVLLFVLMLLINLDKFELFKLLGLSAKLKTSIAEAEVTKAEFEELTLILKNKIEELEDLIEKNKKLNLMQTIALS